MAWGGTKQQATRVRGERRTRQLELSFPSRWGGTRAGAGRKRSLRGKVWHRARPAHRAAEPVHVTLRSLISPLRSQLVFPSVRLALLRAARRDPERFRLLHYSVQRDHVHLIVEAQDKQALSKGIQGLAIRVARYVNDLLRRRGALWADRWHGHALTTPREVRNAIAYVLTNFRKHRQRRDDDGACGATAFGIDPYSSGEWFDGWREWRPRSGTPPPFVSPRALLKYGYPTSSYESANRHEAAGKVVVGPRSWLAMVGWRRHGLVGLGESPKG